MSTRIHVPCDVPGNPLCFQLTPAQVCGRDGADVLIGKNEAGILLADRGYDTGPRTLDRLEAANVESIIQPKANRKELRAYDNVF